jgi:general secretion pathway protein J
VRSGWDNPDDLPRSDLQRVEYRFQNGRLLRLGFAGVDGAGASTVTTLIDEVREVRLRFRDREGLWRDAWEPNDPTELPEAVELIVASARFGPVRQLFRVGSG